MRRSIFNTIRLAFEIHAISISMRIPIKFLNEAGLFDSDERFIINRTKQKSCFYEKKPLLRHIRRL